jgi:Tc toxin complex TcA C-terminal TcB-binding domain/Neuraminidase-like domain
MEIGLTIGAKGTAVQRLHHVLISSGFSIDEEERESAKFGSSTLEALRAFQARNGLRRTKAVDRRVLPILLTIEERISIRVSEQATVPPSSSAERYIRVTGNLVDVDGAPIPKTKVALISETLRAQENIDTGNTDQQGRFAFRYRNSGPRNLAVVAYAAKERILARSATAFGVIADVVISLSTAKDGIQPSLSQIATLQALVAPQLGKEKLSELKENKDVHEVQFLANATGQTFSDIASLYIASRLGLLKGLAEATLFGLFMQKVPPNLAASLANLPEAGIDESFLEQVFAGVLTQSRAQLSAALSNAIAANVIPPSYSTSQDKELSRIDVLRAEGAGKSPFIRGKTSLDDLLKANSIPASVSRTFVQAYADNGGNLDATWQELQANKGVSAAQLATLSTTLSVGEILAGNLPLVKDTLQRLTRGSLSGVSSLALLDQSDWVSRIQEVDPSATSIPPIIEGETPAQRIARFAKALAERIGRRYATVALGSALTKAQQSSFATKKELGAFLTANATLNLKSANIDQYIAANKVAITQPALAELKRAQRLFRVSPHYASVEALNAAGYHSAQSIYLRGRAPFLAQMTTAMGSASLANAAYSRAQTTYAAALTTYATFSLSLNGTSVSAMETAEPDQDALTSLPSLQALFGSLDFCECSDCRSVLSPAAYLVDLLQYLGGRAANNAAYASARDVLIARRPDVQFLALNCHNNITVPYIDIGNEIFEAAISPPSPAVTLIDTIGTQQERRALPQQISQAAYALTASAVFPLSLPFDLQFAQTFSYVEALGSSVPTLLSLMRGSPLGAIDVAIACAKLHINPAMRAVMEATDGKQAWDRWGLAQNPISVVDPKTNEPYSPSPADWTAALGKVPVLLARANLTLLELYQLIEVTWVTQSTVALQLGVTTNNGVQVVSCDTDLMTFTGLTGDVLDRANRFLRLWKASGLAMWELNWALPQSGVINDDFLVFLAGALTVSQQMAIPFQEVLSFWLPLEIHDVTNHLGDEDVVTMSTYSEVFCNATLRPSWGVGSPNPVFVDPAALAQTPILYPAGTVLTPAQSANGNAITAALGLSADDMASIIATGVNNALTLDTLNAMLCYARLASALSLTVSDLTLWIQLTGQAPFRTKPNDTLEFLRRYQVLKSTGLTVYDLDYLLRHQSLSRSAIEFTPANMTALLQSLATSLAKLQQPDPTTIGLIVTQALVAATGASASVVSPVLAKTGLLPLSAATFSQLVAQANNVDASQFPALVSGFTQVAKAAELSTATRASDAEFGFLTQNAKGFNLLDPSALPVAAVNQTPYLGFEALLRALKVNRRQPGLSPKLFDVLTQWVSALPASVSAAIDANFSFALNSNIADVSAIAVALNATTPTLNAAGQPGSLADMAILFAISQALDVVSRFGMSGSTLVQLAQAPAASGTAVAAAAAAAAMGVFQSQYASNMWLGAVQTVEDKLRQMRRDAAVAYILGSGASSVAGASNGSPIVINTVAPHGLQTGMQVSIAGALGNTAANGQFGVTVNTPTVFALNGSAGNGAWTGGGTISPLVSSVAVTQATNATPIVITTAAPHGFASGARVSVDAVQGNTAADGVFTVTVGSPTTITLEGSEGNGNWTAGGTVALAMGDTLQISDDVFDYYLIDPQMCSCGVTTRLLQASLSVQQFVQECFLNLIPEVKVDKIADPRWNDWSWMQQFRLWQANRQVFMYPENYLLPELRTDKSPFFSDLESDLRQSNCDADAAAAAFENYLRKLVEVSRLVLSAHYHETKPDGSRVLHVFAHTRGTPPKWYYRTRAESALDGGIWAAWQPLNVDIASDQVMPLVWDQHLYLVWPVFTKINEKPVQQKVPPAGGTTASPPARTMWAVEIALSELSAGQWQPKRKFAEKMYFDTEDSQAAFTFKAYQDTGYHLQIEVYHNRLQFHAGRVSDYNVGLLGGGQHFPGTTTETPTLVATGTVSMPDSPMTVLEASSTDLAGVAFVDPIFPDASYIDLGQEPSYALIQTQTGFGETLLTPSFYSFAAQDLVYGNYSSKNPGTVVLNVLCASSKSAPTSVKLLGSISNPHIIVPQQESDFNSEDPFFVSDSLRSFLVQPHYFTSLNPPTEIEGIFGSGLTWSTNYVFWPFYHPFAKTFLRELEIGGVDQMMDRNLQLYPETKSGWTAMTAGKFVTQYVPTSSVVSPYPIEEVDFSIDGAYSLYNWEIFYHAPMFIASLLMQNGQNEAAMTWQQYIFNPMDTSTGTAPQRYWQTKPFNQMQSEDWLNQQIEQILTAPNTTTQGMIDAQAIADWLAHPYDPHRIAKLRIGAYAKATVMKFLDNLIAWADSYYSQYTMEAVARAEQLYVLADLILGPQPEQVRITNKNQAANPDTTTYATLQSALATSTFSDPLVEIENLIVAPILPLQPGQSEGDASSLPLLAVSSGSALYFCIPPNAQLLAYWPTVAGRLSNIRHCLNLQGVPQPLPLYAPKIDPLQLIEQQAGGMDVGAALAFTPVYRFATYQQKAIELAEDVRSYGNLVLSALEKKDAEALAALRASQELDIQTQVLAVKALQVTEANDQITVLNNQLAVVNSRLTFYTAQVATPISTWESKALELQGAALLANSLAVVLDIGASVAHLIPSFSGGIDGFGGSPSVTVSFGGSNIASAQSTWAGVARTMAAILSESGSMAATMGSYQRRLNEWNLQVDLANKEITQTQSQITAATDRLNIATQESVIQSKQVANAQAISDFLTNKYTNTQLYDWLVTQLSSVHTQAYQLAFSLAQQAQLTYQYELGSQDTFLQPGYWDAQHRGLTSGDRLLFDLRRMGAQYLRANTLELVLTKNVSLALTQPQALVRLLQTGSCQLQFDESLFDADHPGQFFRRHRRVGITAPSLSGPYTGLNATLTLNSAAIRVQPPTDPYVPASATAIPPTAAFSVSTVPVTAMIATSTGRNDDGQPDARTSLDDRWRPFEGLGAISTWTLVLDPRDNAVDLSTLSDVIFHFTYTARAAGGIPEAVRKALKPQNARSAMISVRHTFSGAYNRFFNPVDSTATQQVLTLPLTSAIFPFSNLGSPSISSVSLYLALEGAPAAGTTLPATWGPVGGASAPVKLTTVPGTTTANQAIAALGVNPPVAAGTTPSSFALTIAAADLPAGLLVAVSGVNRLDPSKIQDIVLVIGYQIG